MAFLFGLYVFSFMLPFLAPYVVQEIIHNKAVTITVACLGLSVAGAIQWMFVSETFPSFIVGIVTFSGDFVALSLLPMAVSEIVGDDTSREERV